MSCLGTHNPSFHTVALLDSSFNLVYKLSKEFWNPERKNTSKHISYSCFPSLALCDSFTAFLPSLLVLWEVERQLKYFIISLPASRSGSAQDTPCCGTCGCKTVGLSPRLCNITHRCSLLLPLLCVPPPAMAQLCKPQRTPDSRVWSISTASGGGTSGWICLSISWQLYFSCRQGC